MSYQLLQLPTAKRQLRKLDKTHNPFLRRIISSIESLSEDPRPPRAEKLTGRADWRIRVVDYRILYVIDEQNKTVTIVSVAHRREVYR